MPILKLWKTSASIAALLASQLHAAQTNPPAPGTLAHQLEADFVAAFEEVAPSVVVIEAEKPDDERDIVWRMFFDAPGDERPNEGEEPQKKKSNKDELPPPKPRKSHPRQEAPQNQGSGTIIRADGYIVTNNHVIEGATKIWVYLRDGTKHEATLVGSEPQADLAVVKIDATNLVPAKLGDAGSARIGQWTIAVGAPFQLEYSYSVGWLSGKKRGESMSQQFMPSHYVQYLQTTAPINPGNSGGPLCNIDGEVIGINTLIRGIGTSVGFAIPADLVSSISQQLIDKGVVTRPWLGIRISSIRHHPDAAAYYPGTYQGVVVETIEPSAPAAASEIKPFDVITAVDGVPVISASDLIYEIVRKKADQQVLLTVLRAKPGEKAQELKLKIQLGAMPRDEETAAKAGGPAQRKEKDPLGIRVEAASDELRDRFELSDAPGVVVTEVEEEGLGAEFDLRVGTLITAIDRQPVASPEDYEKRIKEIDVKKGALVFFVKDKRQGYALIRKTD
ncbi:MAG TPA: trypsin-like peptidase domain-containing protein [Verrucomicrobiae bacterium]|nr:trypsin-like peptidase domain-containing protein [Verrucomicrobiae bacterium]